jgi:hypothetical protein
MSSLWLTRSLAFALEQDRNGGSLLNIEMMTITPS